MEKNDSFFFHQLKSQDPFVPIYFHFFENIYMSSKWNSAVNKSSFLRGNKNITLYFLNEE